MKICDRCFNQGRGATVAIKQIMTSDEQVIDLCSICFGEFGNFLIAAKTEEKGIENAGIERKRGRPPLNQIKAS